MRIEQSISLPLEDTAAEARSTYLIIYIGRSPVHPHVPAADALTVTQPAKQQRTGGSQLLGQPLDAVEQHTHQRLPFRKLVTGIPVKGPLPAVEKTFRLPFQP